MKMSQRTRPMSFTRSQLALAIAVAAAPIASFAAPGSDSDYVTDPQFSFVEDATSRGIGMVNMITCFIGAMAPDQLVNQGDYIALIDQGKCDTNSRSNSSNSGSTNAGASAADYMTVYVNSSRESNTTPMVTKAWFEDSNEGIESTIFVRASATSAPSDDNPYGDFRLDFRGRSDSGNDDDFLLRGYLEAGTNGVTFYQEEVAGDHASTTALKLNTEGTTSGSGRLYMVEESGFGNSDSEFSFAFNDDYFLRDSQCFSRDANDAAMSVWRYGVYDADTGERVELNSGFPIEYTPSGQSTVYHGYLGYYGLHLPPEAATALAAEDSPEVERVEYGGGDEPTRTPYEVVQLGGKLMKYTRNEKTLAEIDGVRFTVFVADNASAFFANAENFQQYEAYWDDDSSTLKVTGSFGCDSNGCSNRSFDTPVNGSLDYFVTRGGVRGWSQSLGGELYIAVEGLSGTPDSSAIEVTYRSQNLVYPSEMPGTLYCLNDCPTASSINAFVNQTDQAPVFSPMENSNNWGETLSADVVEYTTLDGLLVDGNSSEVEITDSSALENFPQYHHGLRSGRLFTSLDDAECQPSSGTYCDHKAFNLETYYVWETGPNSWNQFAAVKDDEGEYVEFDAPWQFSYTVPEGQRYGQFAGQQIVLEYGGFGNLWGIPGQCVNFVTNEPASCEQQNTRYVPAFAIPGGATVTRGDDTYLVKWLDREIRFAKRDASECSALTVPTANEVTLPTVDDYQDPSDENGDNYIGAKPTLDTAPRVIHGSVKY
ncbi:MAG: hypothetical protein IPM37_14290 [Hahellaceae bacterium]|nr:hypothetical protein [Hahellaceae bacterium]